MNKKLDLISFYHRTDEYPTKHSLGSLRLAQKVLHIVEPSISVKSYSLYQDTSTIKSDIKSNGADVIGFGAYIWTREKIVDLVEVILEEMPDKIIMLGGPEIYSGSFLCKRYNDYNNVIFVVGEGEKPFESLLNDLNAFNYDPKHCSKYYINNDNTSIREQINYPSELYSDDFLESYGIESSDLNEFVWFETSRGCPYLCGYCGHKTRNNMGYIDEDIIKKEIINIGRLGVKKVFIVDPILGGIPVRGKKILKLFNEYAPNSKLLFYLRPEYIDEEYAEILSNTNIEELRVGIQTTNPAVPKWIRNNSVNSIRMRAPLLTEHNIIWTAELIVGLPGDDLNGIQQTFEHVIDELQPESIEAYHLTVIDGTKLATFLDGDGELWLKADPKSCRVVESNSYDDKELNCMISYAKEMCGEYERGLSYAEIICT